MKRKKLLIYLVLVLAILALTSCDRTRTVRTREIKTFTRDLKKRDKNVKKLDFYFRRPSLSADLVYDGDLGKEELDLLIKSFKELISLDFMASIGDRYFSSKMPSEFKVYVYLGEKKAERDYDLIISTGYYKSYLVNDDPENIDGYKSWQVY